MAHHHKPYWRHDKAVMRVHVNSLNGLRAAPVREIIFPSLRAHMGISGKCSSPCGDGAFPAGRFSSSLKRLGPSPQGLAHIVAAALPNIPIRAGKLEERISLLNGVARDPFQELRCGHSFSAVVPPVRFGRVSKPGRFSKSIFWPWAIAAGARAFHGGARQRSQSSQCAPLS